MNLPNHGANPLRLYRQAGITPPESWLDFSENVHPFGPPTFIEENWDSFFQLLGSYPDPDAEPFRAAAAKFHGVEADSLAAGNGAAEIFTWLAKRYRGKRVALVEPAFSEYRQTLEAENAFIEEIRLEAGNGWRLDFHAIETAITECSALYICNPHNPTGLLLNTDELKKIAEICLQSDCELVLDEAFIDFVSEAASFIPYLAQFPHVLIVRSMTKMYAIAGLRLGYVMAAPTIIKELTKGAAHWNVNALSASIGASCFGEKDYRGRIIQSAIIERQEMQSFLKEQHCRFTDSAANFLSFKLPKGKDQDLFFQAMLEKGIVLRHTYSFRGMDGEWFRIGMKSSSSMEKLREEITLWLEDN